MYIVRSFLLLFIALVLTACGGGASNVVLQTDLGEIEIQVFEKRAPLSSKDFLYYVDNQLYDGEGFYRSVRPETDPRKLGMQIIQGGLLGLESVTAPIDHETTQMTGLSHIDGAVSIARDEPGTGSAAYFFISIGENKALDYGGVRNPDGQGYAVFGQVVRGMDVVRAIQMRETAGASDDQVTQGQFLTKPATIIKASRR